VFCLLLSVCVVVVVVVVCCLLIGEIKICNMSHFHFVICGPKFTKIFGPNVEGVVVDNAIFRLST